MPDGAMRDPVPSVWIGFGLAAPFLALTVRSSQSANLSSGMQLIEMCWKAVNDTHACAYPDARQFFRHNSLY